MSFRPAFALVALLAVTGAGGAAQAQSNPQSGEGAAVLHGQGWANRGQDLATPVDPAALNRSARVRAESAAAMRQQRLNGRARRYRSASR